MVVDDINLDIDIETVRALGYRIVDIIAHELADPARRSSRPPAQSNETLEALFGGPLPQGGVKHNELLTTIHKHLLPGTSNLTHPRWLAYVLAGSLPLIERLSLGNILCDRTRPVVVSRQIRHTTTKKNFMHF